MCCHFSFRKDRQRTKSIITVVVMNGGECVDPNNNKGEDRQDKIVKRRKVTFESAAGNGSPVPLRPPSRVPFQHHALESFQHPAPTTAFFGFSVSTAAAATAASIAPLGFL